ncbi:unnamed protein product [Polarella glacialis]|uniref:Glycosyltransferase family 32 protein n=1 Tax=Polarella glacialis TaxID=89957 RepID=A0A813HZL8_POLGL|nr:unnamed protein product [Polarella glacialis]
MAKYVASWHKCLGEDWEINLWTDEQNRKIVQEHAPWFLPTYDSYDQKIKRIDSIRYVYMSKIGGIYADVDLECTGDPIPALQNHSAVVAYTVPYCALEPAFMAAAPGHPFWEAALEHLNQTKDLIVQQATGVQFLTQRFQEYTGLPDFHVHDQETFEPGPGVNAASPIHVLGTEQMIWDPLYNWDVHLDPDAGLQYPKCWALNHYAGTWKTDQQDEISAGQPQVENPSNGKGKTCSCYFLSNDCMGTKQERYHGWLSDRVDYVIYFPSLRPAAPIQLKSGTVELDSVMIFNPSFMSQPLQEDVWFVAKGGSFSKVSDAGVYYVSEILFGRISQDQFLSKQSPIKWSYSQFEAIPDPRYSQPGLSGGEFQECRWPVHAEAGMQLGPKDPHLVSFSNQTYLLFTSTNFVPKTEEWVTFPNCRPDDGYMELHMTQLISVQPVVYGPTVSLRFDGMADTEEGWSLFTWASPNSGDKLMAVHSINPHVILEVDVATGNCSQVHSEGSLLLEDLLQKLNTSFAHKPDIYGGAGATFVQDGTQPYFLSVLHYYAGTDLNAHEYFSHPYKFSAAPPFEILDIGARLPLVTLSDTNYFGTGQMTYVSSVGLLDGHVVLGYGEGNQRSRVYRQRLEAFNDMFFRKTHV